MLMLRVETRSAKFHNGRFIALQRLIVNALMEFLEKYYKINLMS